MKLPLDLVFATLEALARSAVLNFERQLGPGTGPEKKRLAVQWVWEKLAPYIPDKMEGWLRPLAEVVLGFTVDSVIAYLNRHQAWPPLTLWPTAAEPALPGLLDPRE